MKRFTLYAQPAKLEPYLDRSALEEGLYEEVEAGGGAVAFTDAGRRAWEVLSSIYQGVEVEYGDARGALEWSLALHSSRVSIRLTATPYSFISRVFGSGGARGLFLTIELEGKEDSVSRFIWKLMKAAGRDLWEIADWDRFSAHTGVTRAQVVKGWKRFRRFELEHEAAKDGAAAEKKEEGKVEVGGTVAATGSDLLLRVNVKNSTSRPISDLVIKVEYDRDALRTDKAAQELSVLRPYQSSSLIDFLLTPLREFEGTVGAAVEFTEEREERPRPDKVVKKRVRRRVRIEPLPVSMRHPLIEPHPLDDGGWKSEMAVLRRMERSGVRGPVPAQEFFESLLEKTRDWPFHRLDPLIEQHGAAFRGHLRYSAAVKERGERYGLTISVTGDRSGSKADRVFHAAAPDGLLNLYWAVDSLQKGSGLVPAAPRPALSPASPSPGSTSGDG